MRPPITAQGLAGDGRGEVRHWTAGGFENDAVLLDERQGFKGSHDVNDVGVCYQESAVALRGVSHSLLRQAHDRPDLPPLRERKSGYFFSEAPSNSARRFSRS